MPTQNTLPSLKPRAECISGLACPLSSGALRRRVWIDMSYFKWHVNQYIIFVAPPGIVSKSTTVAIAMDLLRKVPGVQFGPDVVTWPALVTAFAAATEQFQLGEEWYTQSALTLVRSEFGNLVNPQDQRDDRHDGQSLGLPHRRV